MKVDDRGAIAEHLIYQLWKRNYFSSIPLKTIEGHEVKIISTGIKNEDTGPDFKGITIKLDDQIYHGDLEIHRAPEDWYRHSHHADPAYNNVIMHLVIGPANFDEPTIRLNRHPVAAQVFVEISDHQFAYLAKEYRLFAPASSNYSFCSLKEKDENFKLSVINYFSRMRLQDKADRFTEQREVSSWNQILYVGIMGALGYSKNQIPFRKLTQLLPFEALMLEFRGSSQEEALLQPLSILFGFAGLLPSQDTSFDWRKVNDQETQDYVAQLEKIWHQFSDRLGITPMKREEWQFFRLRPCNFPTRRLAGACLIWRQFTKEGILETLLKNFRSYQNNHRQTIKELENYFVCSSDGYWATHYQLDEKPPELYGKRVATLVGKERSQDIVVNVILPVFLAYADEIEDARLKIKIFQIYQEYPLLSSNSIIKEMGRRLFDDEKKVNRYINTAAKQQGLIHLYKLYCHRGECDTCRREWEHI